MQQIKPVFMEKSLGIPDDFALVFRFEWGPTERQATDELGPPKSVEILEEMVFGRVQQADSGMIRAAKAQPDHRIEWILDPSGLVVYLHIDVRDMEARRRYPKNILSDVQHYRARLLEKWENGKPSSQRPSPRAEGPEVG